MTPAIARATELKFRVRFIVFSRRVGRAPQDHSARGLDIRASKSGSKKNLPSPETGQIPGFSMKNGKVFHIP
jgi:hypothetical protein